MDREDCFSISGQLSFCVFNIKVQGDGINIDHNRDQAKEPHRCYCSPECRARYHDLAAGRKIKSKKHRCYGTCAIEVCLAVWKVKMFLPLFFKSINRSITRFSEHIQPVSYTHLRAHE